MGRMYTFQVLCWGRVGGGGGTPGQRVQGPRMLTELTYFQRGAKLLTYSQLGFVVASLLGSLTHLYPAMLLSTLPFFCFNQCFSATMSPTPASSLNFLLLM